MHCWVNWRIGTIGWPDGSSVFHGVGIVAIGCQAGWRHEKRYSGQWRSLVPHSRMARFFSPIGIQAGRQTKRWPDLDAAADRLSQ
jgi:hypothetical protein